MNESAKTVVEEMFAAFAQRDVGKILKTVSADSLWIYHGTQIIPKSEYKGKDGAEKILHCNFQLHRNHSFYATTIYCAR